jgi:predicted dehydrogenase
LIRVAIIGAGSIGCHLAFSCRKSGWNVTVFDTSEIALERLKSELYPKRYGSWDPEIKVHNMIMLQHSSVLDFDAILIGTPPDTHVEVLYQCISLEPKVIMIEKPLCPPNETQIEILRSIFSTNLKIKYLAGYNHRVSRIVNELKQAWERHGALPITKIEVNWLEDWSGILNAHPWLRGPEDSYLGFTDRGGGALFEHSHGLDLWLHLANFFGIGNPKKIDARTSTDINKGVLFSCEEEIEIEIETDTGFVGRVHQDVRTNPAVKQVNVSDSRFSYVLDFHIQGTSDRIKIIDSSDGEIISEVFVTKKRFVDFDEEICEIQRLLSHSKDLSGVFSPLDAISGLKTAEIGRISLISAVENHMVVVDQV